MHVQVNESGSNDQISSIKFFIRAALNLPRRGDFRHPAVPEQDVHRRIDLLRRVDDVAAFDEQRLIPIRHLSVAPRLSS